MPSVRSLYLFLSGRPASLPSLLGWYRSGPGASGPAGAPADSPRRSFSSSRGAAGKRWRARRSEESNKWSDYPITSLFTSVRQQNMARRETNRSHLANAVSNIGDAQRPTSSCSPSKPQQRKIQVLLPDCSLQHSSKCPWKNPLRLKPFYRVAGTLSVPAHHQSSLRSVRGEGEVRQGAWDRG